MEKAMKYLGENSTTILVSIGMVIGGLILAKVIRTLSKRVMAKAKIDRTVINFLSQVLYVILIVIILISTLNYLGAPTASLIAMIGALGIAVGLALKDTLANFAAGIIILIFKPFKADDLIDVNNFKGTVHVINIMSTEIITRDNKKIFIPNSVFTDHSIINYSSNKNRKIQLIVDIAYDADHQKAIEILKNIFSKDKRIVNNNDLEIGLFNFAASSVQIVCYPEFKTENYWPVYYDTLEQIKLEFDKNGIEIPFTNQTIHIKNIEEVTR